MNSTKDEIPLVDGLRRERERYMAAQKRKDAETGMSTTEKIAQWKEEAALDFGEDGVELLIATFLSIRLADFEEWLSQQGIDPLQSQGYYRWIEYRAKRLDKLTMLLAKLGDAGEIIHQGLLTSVGLQVPQKHASQVDSISLGAQLPFNRTLVKESGNSAGATAARRAQIAAV